MVLLEPSESWRRGGGTTSQVIGTNRERSHHCQEVSLKAEEEGECPASTVLPGSQLLPEPFEKPALKESRQCCPWGQSSWPRTNLSWQWRIIFVVTFILHKPFIFISSNPPHNTILWVYYCLPPPPKNCNLEKLKWVISAHPQQAQRLFPIRSQAFMWARCATFSKALPSGPETSKVNLKLRRK